MKTISKRLLCILLSVILLLAALPLTVSAATVKNVSTAAELADACTEINTNGGEYTINLTDDIIDGSISITKSTAVVTVIGNGNTIFQSRTAVYVSNGAKVTLGDGNSELNLQGDNQFHADVESNDNPGLVYVLEGSECNMSNKVMLMNHKGNNYLGGGVTVEGGTFHMYGGTIQNCGIDGGSVCYGGGVAVFAGGTFIMDNGTITNCYAKSDYAYTWDDYYNYDYKTDPRYTVTACGGGVFVAGGSSFIMNNGTISNNSVLNTDDNGMAYGGGVAMMITLAERNDPNVLGTMGNPQSSVTINGGTITGNQAECGGGIYASGYFYTYNVPIATAAPQGSVTENPGLYINGGEISSNTATDAGGGIFTVCLCPWNRANNNDWKGSKTQIHNAVIKNNTADNGAGIESYSYWTQMDIDGCTITGNSAESYGGGIALIGNASSGLTRLKNTTVTGNTSGDIGAGVLYDSQSLLYISGADIIQDNTYNGKLNNLNVWDVDYPVYVNGDLTGSQIGLSDPDLWDDDLEDTDPNAASADHLTSGYRTYDPDVHPDQYFTSDHETWYVDRSEQTKEETVDPSSVTYREYTVNRYPYIPASDPKLNPLYGQNNEYVYSEIKNPDIDKISSFNDLYNEMKYKYSDTSKYTKSTDVNNNGNIYLKYSILDSTYPTTLTIQKTSSNNYATVTFSQSPITGKGGSIVFRVYLNDQTLYADTKELVYKVYDTTNYISNSNYSYAFSEDYTTKSIKYVNTNPPADTIYEYDDYGNLTAKLEIVGGVSNYTLKQKTTEIITGNTDEVRLTRKETVDYHINNEDISSQSYDDNDLFTQYVDELVHTVSIGDTIEEFYLIPQHDTEYIFKGWYYDPENDDDDRPVQFGTDKYIKGKDIYAHWIKVEDVDEDPEDDNELPPGDNGRYGGFDLTGVQIRTESVYDSNFDYEKKPAGMRFVTSLSTDVVEQINAIRPNNIEYGYVAATNEGWINYHDGKGHKLQYISKTANGIDTSETATDDNYFDFASNINCTSRQTNTSGVVYEDHRNYNGYLLYTLVITYENVDDTGYDKKVLARPYIHYTDANGLERVAYSEYRGGSNTLGGCYTSYNGVN